MFDHLGIQTDDVQKAVDFYLNAFAPLGFHEAQRIEFPGVLVVGLAGASGIPQFWLSGRMPDAGTDENHIAFAAPDRAAVDAVHEAAVAYGATVLHAPREWPEYHPGYYGVFLRDPDGNNVEAVHHG